MMLRVKLSMLNEFPARVEFGITKSALLSLFRLSFGTGFLLGFSLVMLVFYLTCSLVLR